ncbi:MAG: immunoglobulin domain-containing protein [Flavobacterium sp.]|uniref:immunoglobulin domain-containing protein n=2 Tax=Flavobacterium sp. TaxID=239 RepID=UPI0040342F5C
MIHTITLKKQLTMLFLLIATGLSAQTLTTTSPTLVTHRSAMILNGSGFTAGLTVRFYTSGSSATSSTNFVDVTPSSVTSTQMSVIVPAVASAGAGTVTRSIRFNNGGTLSSAYNYTYVAPVATPTGSGITQIVTNFGGSWVSSTAANNSVQPDTGHSVVGFRYGGVLYSTGSEPAVANVLTAAGFASGNGTTANTYLPGNFRALPVKSISGTVPASNSSNPCLIILGNKTDGSSTTAVHTAPSVTGLSPRDVLIDGIRGMGIGSGVTNLPTYSVLSFQSGNIVNDNTVLTDAIPDILVSQIASPSGEFDVFSFIDVNGNIVGNPVQIGFSGTSSAILGHNKIDLFTMATPGQLDTAIINGSTVIGTNTREIRMVGYKLSDFGITGTNKAQVASFKVMPSGTSDPAFMAYNRSTFEIPAPEINSQPVSQAVCPGGTASFTISVTVGGSEITYQWEKNGNPISNGGNISGATSATLQIANVTAADAGVYRCLVTNNTGAAFSNAAYLNTVILSATGTTGCVNTGTNTTRFVEAGAQGINLAYQWYDNGTNNSNTGGSLITGATSSTYYPPMNTIGTKYYYAKVYNTGTSTAQCTAVFTSAVAATVTATANAGIVSANQVVCSGSSAIFTTTGYTGTLQWQDSADGTTGWANVTTGSGGTTQTYTTAPLTQARYYRVIATSGGGDCTATSQTRNATLTTFAVWEGDVSNDWNTAGNWACGVVPTLLTDAQIPVVTSPNVYPRITGATGGGFADVRNITIATGANIVVANGGSGVFRIAGTVNNTGVFDAQDGTVVFMGTSGAQAVGGDTFFNKYVRNLTINNTNGFTLAGELNLTGILTMTAGQFTTGNQLTLKSNAVHTAMIAPVTGSISGTMTIERYIPARRAFRLISSPVDGLSIYANWQQSGSDLPNWGTDITGAGGAANGFDVSGSNNPSLFTYDNAGGTSWNAVTSTLTNNLIAGQPLRMLVRGDRTINQASNYAVPTTTTLRSTGTIKTGTVTVTDLRDVAGKFSFVGNPYQAPVNMESVMAEATNINTGFYYMWDPTLGGANPTVGQAGGRGAYVTVLLPGGTNTAGSAANKYVMPNQAFFVQTVNDGAASLTFRESHKTLLTNNTPNVYRSAADATDASIALKIYDQASFQQNETPSDGLIIDFSDMHSNELDTMDAPKMGNQDENLAILKGTARYSVERRATPVLNDVIQLFNNQYRKEAYTYAADVNGMENGLTAYLQDKFANTMTELVNGERTLYNFNVDANNPLSVAENRFDIIFQTTALGNGGFDAASFKVYPNPASGSEFFIDMPASPENTTVIIFNTIGQQIGTSISTQAGNTVKVVPDTKLADGVYMIRISNGKSVATKKLIIK